MKAFPSVVKCSDLFHDGLGSNVLLWLFLVVPSCLGGFGPLARRGNKEEHLLEIDFFISGNSWCGVSEQDIVLGRQKQQQKALGLPGTCPGQETLCGGNNMWEGVGF